MVVVVEGGSFVDAIDRLISCNGDDGERDRFRDASCIQTALLRMGDRKESRYSKIKTRNKKSDVESRNDQERRPDVNVFIFGRRMTKSDRQIDA